MTFRKTALICITLSGLAGCTGSTNPETAGLFDNIANLSSGEYDRQIQSNQAQAQQILRNNQAAQQRIDSLQNQSASNARAISGLRSQVAAAQRAAASARARVAGDSAKTAELSALERQLTTVAAEVNSGNADPGVATSELRRIRSAIAAL